MDWNCSALRDFQSMTRPRQSGVATDVFAGDC
ncbi:unnamed protein product [Protopolystoma xenopodis]|uniref:Uncharacterized protein n=1 Tax=Protopolystoma xenopodis TaxID=117903 RepID=A0A448X1A8_9PLAT|nr:unnamed protein product [Protopolystoma xenopodis]